MNVVLIIPTGLGAEIGGHAGDANPVAKLIAKCCDKVCFAGCIYTKNRHP